MIVRGRHALETSDGRSIADWFLVGGLICFRGRHGDTGELLNSDDRWYAQFRDYLRLGAPEYESHAEIARQAEPGAAADRGV